MQGNPHASAQWRNGAEGAYIVGILPGAHFGDANPYLDLAVPVGPSHLQNAIVPLSADMVVAIGGAAGTHAELALAWQFKKPIALLGAEGWSGKLVGQKLDYRREERLRALREWSHVQVEKVFT